jgi:predicted short-subunit dehydrogenase-like oxidoreductase (DUF2520 family)
MNDFPALVIIGPGKVGTALGALAFQRGSPVAALGGRDRARLEAAAPQMGEPRIGLPKEVAGLGQIVLLTVSDDAIERVCQEIASAGAFAAGSIVAHCSGALDSAVLRSARERCGCTIASIHPLQTFPTVQAAVERLPGTAWFGEGEEEALGAVERLAFLFGAASVHRLAPGGKAAYHAAAVLASNGLVALLDAALAASRQAGLSRDTAALSLRPLIHATLANVEALGTEAALTGPIARGDLGAVQRHLEALADDPDLRDVYCALGRWTVSLALRKGSLDASVGAQIRVLLS